MSMTLNKIALVVGFLSLSVLPALAQAPAGQPVRVRGTIISFSDHTLTVSTREGTTMPIAVADPATVSVPKVLALGDIKAGDYVGVAAEPGKAPDGDSKAIAVQVFPATARGTGEGSFGWDLTPTSTMTNGNVDAEASSVDGRVLTVSFKGKTAKIDVPVGTPVYTPAAATTADLVPGAKVMVFGVKAADGKVSTSRVLVGKDGINPPS